MSEAICVTCGVQHEGTPERCAVCEDPRQYVPPGGQRWTSLDELRAGHRNRIAAQAELEGIGTEPRFAIGQRALLVPHTDGQVLWDCVSLLDEETVAAVEARGGLHAIAISHPHYYSSMVEWGRSLGCPVLLHADDREWVMRSDPVVEHWDGESLDLGAGLTLLRLGGHFAGGTVLHQAGGSGGAGTLLSGDVVQVVPDRTHVSFMWSYPNLVPLPGAEVERIAAALEPWPFATLHGAWWDTQVDDAHAVVQRSAARYVRALERVGG